MTTDYPKPYVPSVGSDDKDCVNGPGNGFGYYAGTLWPDCRFSSKSDAQAAATLCNEAYRQGFELARRHIRQALGV
jgi:hypothetical protein